MWKLGRKPDDGARAAQERVKGHLFEAFGRDPDIAFSVNEIICTDPGCPGTETIILVMVPQRKTAACKVQKPMADVTEDDVRDALLTLSHTP